jgi:hypothetical protein
MKSGTYFVGNSATVLVGDVLPRLLETAVIAVQFAVKGQLIALIGGAAATILVLSGFFMLAKKSGWRSRKAKRRSRRVRRPLPPPQFEDLRRSTKCPFAHMARLIGASLTGPGNLDRRIIRLVPRLIRMTNEGREKRLDGFILRIPARSLAADLEMLSKTVNHVLRFLAKHDPTGCDCFVADVVAEDWQFSFNGTRFFITTFAPFYGTGHSRFSARQDSAFIYFQPEYSFDHHGVFAGNPDRERLKERVRQAFANGGTEYSVILVKQPIEAYKYVKPLKVGDPPVEWWNAE